MTTRRVLASATTVVALLIALLFVWYARDVLLLLFAGVLFAVFLRRLALLISRPTRTPPAVALVLVLLCLVGSLIAAFWLQGDRIAVESSRLREDLPNAMERLRERIAGYHLGEQLIEQLPDDPAALLPDEPDAVSKVTGVVSSTFSALASALVILFLGIVLAATPSVYVNGVLALIPDRKVPRIREILTMLNETLWWWLVGRLISMAFIGIVTGVGLALLGVPLAFILGLLAALLSFIPNLGPILSAVPAVILGLAHGPRTALWVAALYVGVQLFESYVLDPIIDRKTIYLPPALTIAAQLVMALVAGLLGITLATPLAAAAVVLITMLYVQDVLGRRDVRVRSH